jgi:5-(carboxyamino)imidazole ribonucleotide synthase
MKQDTIGILGGGQLGRMLALAGYPLGLRFRFVDPSPLAPSGQLAELHGCAYDDLNGLDAFAAGLRVVTYEFENVPVVSARHMAEHVPVYPPPQALETAQDRLHEKTLFNKLGVETPPFAPLLSRAELQSALDRIGFPAVLKTRRMGYDGKGQAILREQADVDPVYESLKGVDLILEGFVPFERELSILSARSTTGETAVYPLVENHHRDGILRVSLAPAPQAQALQSRAEEIAGLVLKSLDYVGLLAIELFQYQGRLLANEMAPRVHNSGHWTIEGAETSQFENHLRAILGLPLGSTAALGHPAMLNIIGDLPDMKDILAIPGAHAHYYGKSPARGRKVGHITIVARTEAERAEKIQQLSKLPGVRTS